MLLRRSANLWLPSSRHLLTSCPVSATCGLPYMRDNGPVTAFPNGSNRPNNTKIRISASLASDRIMGRYCSGQFVGSKDLVLGLLVAGVGQPAETEGSFGPSHCLNSQWAGFSSDSLANPEPWDSPTRSLSSGVSDRITWRVFQTSKQGSEPFVSVRNDLFDRSSALGPSVHLLLRHMGITPGTREFVNHPYKDVKIHCRFVLNIFFSPIPRKCLFLRSTLLGLLLCVLMWRSLGYPSTLLFSSLVNPEIILVHAYYDMQQILQVQQYNKKIK
jgi:hypothetical protein